MIQLEKITVAFGRTLALHDVDATIQAGVTGVFGPNGAGKSTLLRVAAGLLRPSSGRVLVDGREFSPPDESQRALVGYAGHDSGLYPALTVEENVALFARLHGAPRANIERSIGAVGLSDRKDARVSSLSAGLKKRASLARALVHDPQILVLDEPYANLDDEAADRVTQAIEAWRRPGRLALIATHGAKRLKAFADASLVLRRGEAASHRATDWRTRT